MTTVYMWKEYLAKPEPPTNLKTKILRIYYEPAKTGEKNGWSDWSKENKPYNKFKYTIKNIRIVFIVTKDVEFEDFKNLLEVKYHNYFNALKKYYTLDYMYETAEKAYMTTRELAENPVLLLDVLPVEMFTKRELRAVAHYIATAKPQFKQEYDVTTELEVVERRKAKIIISEYGILPFELTISIERKVRDFVEFPVVLGIRMLMDAIGRPTALRIPNTNRMMSLQKYIEMLKAAQKKYILDYNKIKLQINFIMHHSFSRTYD